MYCSNGVRAGRLLLVGLCLALGSGAASAQTPDASRWYIGLLGGLNFTEETSADTASGVATFGKLSSLSGADAEISHRRGWGAGALAGYDFGPFRLQADLVFRRSSFDKTTVSGVEADASGHVSSLAPTLSAFYDIPTGTRLVPYVGAGIGATRTAFSSNGVREHEWGFAYQGVGGLRYEMSRTLAMGIEYRYFESPARDFDESEVRNYGYRNHSVFLGITYGFGRDRVPAPALVPASAPPPPAAPPSPPAPELARAYLVFFDWNSATVTVEGATILTEAATAARQRAVTRLDVTGHADRSGTPAYNQALSDKRGAAVKNALVQLGVPASQISVIGKGEVSPLVPTEDGVREPQNRRVEIVLP